VAGNALGINIMLGIRRIAVLGLAMGICGPAVLAQQDTVPPAHPVQVALNYSYMRANAAPGQCGCFNMTGGSGEFAVQAWRGFSAVADLTGEFAGSSNIPGQSLALVFVTAGPRFTYHTRRFPRYAPFAQGLVGVVHGFDAPFPNNSGSTTGAASALAAFVGGGLDISINRYLAVRPIQADYGYSQLPNSINAHQNVFRYSAGIVLCTR
jgi:outer membrane immunogenic protein